MSSSKNRTALLAAPLLLLTGLLAGCAGGGGTRTAPTPSAASSTSAAATGTAASPGGTARALAGLERRFHARLGVYAIDTGTGRTVTYRADERFAHCSTFKVLAAGLLLKRSTDAQLDRVVTYHRSDLQSYAPITSRHVGTGMRLRDLVDASLRYSDNTAANLILEQLGGPWKVQAALRGLGDATTDVDRTEPALNDATPGDTRDTSTPRALATDLRRFVLGNVLPGARRTMLESWLARNTTGGPYIRAGVPAGWKVEDKTGNGDYGTRNDIAVVRPPHGSPIVIAVLSDRGVKNATSDDALIADATKAAVAALR
ncbi:class A beta-lactamase [Streptomyces sp. SL13]|uniref:Class A beta-lactamase n=1 Tax=Streptantibioticus silvisoli TaxID=2705255 RepID=A0AA90H6E8_9ACTN|nr:class A beta-lactamase [Streptantibioticus silvisoli]MDI5968872.1 class A beta-lactamase [Streptantibioticus silvisoli]